ncbi:aldo/keto reductase [Amphritea pacifica]|uniref:Aldo/keto reductase n=1 Tax=Amphritea pacifica TaxID=2811233 RepID=A0ABS2WBN9_9GAMM|nr:aldo/keto reductase [Amphritea pacifica]MBN0989132.1 aldo/keto reductase [Amphritea pacifica]
MNTRKLGSFECSPIGLGCMNLSHAYGTPPSGRDAEQVLLRALDMGYSMLDTAALYGFGNNEILLGKALKGRRNDFVLASKCGMFKNDAGVREINGRPEMIKKTCEDSLRRLQTDVIDLYYLHRWDKNVPIEDSVGALSDLVSEGKIRDVGLSEVSADTLRKAHKTHPIAAVQTEYSLWTRNAEIAVLDTCRELGATFVAFSPLARAFLTGKLRDVNTLEERDIRRGMPRFYPENYAENLQLLDRVETVAKAEGMTLAQLSLAWLLGRDENIIPIPGTTNPDHLKENISAVDLQLSAEAFLQLDQIINQNTVTGSRYNPATQTEIDTEEFV